MDSDLAYLYLQMQADEEDDLDDQEGRVAAAALLLLITVEVEELRRSRARQRNSSRLYLCRPQLLPDPRGSTPWQQLWASRCDRAYITTMGFDVNTFDFLLERGFSHQWQNSLIPQTDTNMAGLSHPYSRSLDSAGALGLVLHYLNSTMREISLQQIFALIPSTVSRYVTFGLKILADLLPSIHEARIRWPTSLSTLHRYNTLIRARHPLLTGAFGTIDGLNLLLQVSADTEIENATYNGWTATHNVSSILVFSPEGLFSIPISITRLTIKFRYNYCCEAERAWQLA